MNKTNSKTMWQDAAFFTAGAVLYALSVHLFTAPANIAPGGATGVATLLHTLFGAPIGITVLLLNLPLFLIAGKQLGWRFLPKTLLATALSSLLIDLFALFVPVYQGNRLLAALYGGVTAGIGLTLIFLRGGTTGGTDLTARLLQPHFPALSFGQILMGLDGLIIISSGFVFRDVDSALYACIVIFATTTVVDRLLYNAGMGKMMYIISQNPHTIARAILQKLHRGVTLLTARGGYSQQEKLVIFCVVRRGEVYRVKQVVQESDPSAFVIVADAGQVMGEGFSILNQ